MHLFHRGTSYIQIRRGRNHTLALAVTKNHFHFLIVESVTFPLLLQQPKQSAASELGTNSTAYRNINCPIEVKDTRKEVVLI
jgi:hypothetical protein